MNNLMVGDVIANKAGSPNEERATPVASGPEQSKSPSVEALGAVQKRSRKSRSSHSKRSFLRAHEERSLTQAIIFVVALAAALWAIASFADGS